MIVTFEQAKKLEDLGCDLQSNSEYIGYVRGGKLVTRQEYNSDREYQIIPRWVRSPMISDALQWFRDKKNILCAVELVSLSNRFGTVYGYKYGGAYIDENKKAILLDSEQTFPEAELALLDALIKYCNEKGTETK